jgi:molecular chaperone DnaK
VYELSEISALILSELKDIAQSQLEKKVLHAVITVPAYYGDLQRQAVKKAGSLAGLIVDRIVNEPTAAAVAYGYNKNLKQRVLVYDFGGGTFDVSVLQVKGNDFKVLATGGDTFLGGVDIDNRMVAYAVDRFREATGKDLASDKMAVQRIRAAAELSKRELSTQTSVELLLPYITQVNGKPVDMKIIFSRDLLNRLSIDLVDRTLEICDDVLASISCRKTEIEEILLVGGQTRMPLVQDQIKNHFGKLPRKGVHPDEVVAIGAAILANPDHACKKVALHDVLSIPIGIALAGGKFKVILDRNTPVPASKSYRVTLTREDSLVVDVYQGESPAILQNEYLGTFTFPNPAPGKRGGRTLEMKFELGAECLLTVLVRDLETHEQTLVKMMTLQSPKSLQDSLRNATEEERGWIKKWARKIFGKGP